MHFGTELFGEENQLIIYHKDLSVLYEEFSSRYRVIEAGGGLVRNSKNQILLIYRHETWDLPKGKIEKGENNSQAALREVEEECGINDLKLGKFVETTYHIYQDKGQEVLKISHWYEMFSEECEFTPQIEEGISAVSWFHSNELDLLLENTYPNIRLLLNLYR